ncbi:zinc ABC transporter permease [Xaviernesmea oryzae]|uniref:Zinc ABC transporter permease n=1 Tax=Xaviernesmea oryzae TaxID=464029 RepID=A0A1Q9B3H0_9HYPH|nr:zinc ABC transporter permease AztB [Xaviernesmea oryzae]OLP62591.1 zinc ABC transporter permease [Xaviernesmea oryzae]SEM18901.1 zinc/manganese transport system permease protein [Xaviernesmea oryzae]
MYEFLIAPFVDYVFLQRALAGSIMLCLSSGPVGVFLMLRRMSLTGDALAHGILPGAAVAFLFFGLDLAPMTLGGLIAGLLLALLAGAVSRLTLQKEDASLAAFYLISLSAGVLIVSMHGSNIDLMHILFGTVLALNDQALMLIAGIFVLSTVGLALFWRGLVAECLDPLFFRSVSRLGTPIHFAFLFLVVLNLVGGFQALGTLLSVGLMMLPAASARFWVNRVGPMCALAVAFGMVSSVAGLLLSYHAALPTGPAIILFCGAIYALSILGAPRGILLTHLRRTRPHRAA